MMIEYNCKNKEEILRKPTEEEIAQFENQSQNKFAEIQQLKDELATTDYKCLKFVDGALTEDEYAPVRLYRQSLRDKINLLEETE